MTSAGLYCAHKNPTHLETACNISIGCPQYIRSYPPYLEAASSIRNLRTRHAVAYALWE
jgi:hypothetical protein